MACRKKPDLILLDVSMPEMDGETMLARLRALPETQSIRVIVLSAKGQEDNSRVRRELGADDYILKSFDPAELLNKIAHVLSA